MENTLGSIPNKIRIESLEEWKALVRAEIMSETFNYHMCSNCSVADECDSRQNSCPAYDMLREFINEPHPHSR